MATDLSQTSSSTSVSLIRRLRDKDPDAWSRLTRIHGPLVYRWCRRAGLRTDDTADVVQDVFRAVAVGIGGFRRQREGDSFRGWLFGITRNKVNDHFRRAAARPEAAGGAEVLHQLAQVALPDQPSENTVDDRSLVVREALGLIRTEFEEKNWQAFWRTTVDGQTSTDVAAELGMAAGAVRQAKYRVLRRLRRELEELDDD